MRDPLVVGVVCCNYYDTVLFCFPADLGGADLGVPGSTMATVSGSTMATVSVVTLVLVTLLTMSFV